MTNLKHSISPPQWPITQWKSHCGHHFAKTSTLCTSQLSPRHHKKLCIKKAEKKKIHIFFVHRKQKDHKREIVGPLRQGWPLWPSDFGLTTACRTRFYCTVKFRQHHRIKLSITKLHDDDDDYISDNLVLNIMKFKISLHCASLRQNSPLQALKLTTANWNIAKSSDIIV